MRKDNEKRRTRISSNINDTANTFINLCFSFVNTEGPLRSTDKDFCDNLIADYQKYIKDYSLYELDKMMNYFEMNSLIQSKLASILSSNDKRGLLNSYIVEYGFKIKEYISEKLNEKHINEFAVEDIHWVQYILDYIKNQISLYLIVIDETENSFAERKDELLSSVQDYKDELKKTKNEIIGITNTAVNDARNILPHLLTALGIFVAIIIAVVAVYLNDLIKVDSIDAYASPYTLIARYVVSAHMIMDIILILVYLIARITDKNILLRCGRFRLKNGALLTEDEQKYYRPCALCEYNQYCKSHIKLWFKASYIILINVAFIFAYIVLFAWWIIDKYIWNNIGYKIASNPLINNLYNSKQVAFGSVCLVVLLIVAIIALCIVWSVMHKSIEKFKKNIKEHDSKEPTDE